MAAAFDPQRSFRAFGVTAAGELVLLVVPSGVAAHQCRVSRVQVEGEGDSCLMPQDHKAS